MTLQELRYVVALADEGHFARAAQVCHVGQSTLSTQLKKLEEYLRVPLFDRSLHHVQPTPVGEEIITKVRVVLNEVDEIREIASYHRRTPMSGPLHLGVISSLCPYLIPHLIPIFRKTFPKLRLYLREGLASNLLDQLQAGKLDALLLALPVPIEGLDMTELFREPFDLALPAGHPLTKKKEIRRIDLIEQSVLALEEDSELEDQLPEIYESKECEQYNDVKETNEVKETSLETLRHMVAEGLGCALLPTLATTPGITALQKESIEFRPFAQPAPSRTIVLTWRQRFPRSETIKQLAELIRAHLPENVEVVVPCEIAHFNATANRTHHCH